MKKESKSDHLQFQITFSICGYKRWQASAQVQNRLDNISSFLARVHSCLHHSHSWPHALRKQICQNFKHLQSLYAHVGPFNARGGVKQNYMQHLLIPCTLHPSNECIMVCWCGPWRSHSFFLIIVICSLQASGSCSSLLTHAWACLLSLALLHIHACHILGLCRCHFSCTLLQPMPSCSVKQDFMM